MAAWSVASVSPGSSERCTSRRQTGRTPASSEWKRRHPQQSVAHLSNSARAAKTAPVCSPGGTAPSLTRRDRQAASASRQGASPSTARRALRRKGYTRIGRGLGHLRGSLTALTLLQWPPLGYLACLQLHLLVRVWSRQRTDGAGVCRLQRLQALQARR